MFVCLSVCDFMSDNNNNANTQNYFYKDFEGEELGPFSYAEMRDWWDGNYFDPQLLIRKECETAFTPISEHPKEFPPSHNVTNTNKKEEEEEKPQQPQGDHHQQTSHPLPPPPPPPDSEDEDNSVNTANDDTPLPPPPPKKPHTSEDNFYYKDKAGQIQGPFPLEQMKAWTHAGFFPRRHLVAVGAESEFRPIEQFPALLAAFPGDAAQDARTAAEVSNYQAQQVNAFSFYQQYHQQRMAAEEQRLKQRVAELGATSEQQYLAIGKFNSLTGAFQDDYSGPFNEADRELSDYLDIDKYQEFRREHQRLLDLGLARTKKPKKPKEPKKG